MQKIASSVELQNSDKERVALLAIEYNVGQVYK